jgi:predicted DCC family thiol-disulfide oxidoreductase YuxK
MDEHTHILLYDSVCNLCNRLVIFLIKIDKKADLKFASFQSATGAMILTRYKLSRFNNDSLVYVEHEQCYTQSTAVFRILKTIGRGWRLFYAFMIVPRFIRDYCYRLIAHHRYKLFGKSESCETADHYTADRFLK